MIIINPIRHFKLIYANQKSKKEIRILKFKNILNNDNIDNKTKTKNK